jgi:hypothetical protein
MSNLSLLYDTLLKEQDPAEKLLIVTKLKDWIYKLDLYSSNESLEEISTKNLKFLSLPVHEAGALSELSFENISERIEILDKSSQLIQEFLEKIKFLANDIFKTEISYKNSRDEIIKEYKREVELKEYIKILQKRNDEEGIREFLLKDLEYQVLKAKKILKSNNQELELLKNSKEVPKIVKEKNNTDTLLDKQGKVQRPFIITSDRKKVQEGVFRNSHNLPTMSIDEYLAREFERGNFLTQKDDGPVVEEDEDQKLEKERRWDDFKDDNPRGWGNRLNKS